MIFLDALPEIVTLCQTIGEMSTSSKRFHRVFVDGCFDLPHFGHYNFMRQCREISEEVYAGISSDEEIRLHKGPCVFTCAERQMMMDACKWTTATIPDCPYDFITPEFLDQYGCDAAVHGDDPSVNEDGVFWHEPAMKVGRFAQVPRTKAVSTTNIIGRILRLPKAELPPGFDANLLKDLVGDAQSLHTYIPTTQRIFQFSQPKAPQYGDKIVYCDGTFDLLHPGHVSFLKKAKELGDYLVVGIHDDPTMEARLCSGMPILTVQERVLNVLAMKYVDDVIIGAPYVITRELMDQVLPSVVVQGSNPTRTNQEDAFNVPKQLGIYREIESGFPDFTAKTVIRRILDNYMSYANRNSRKEKEFQKPDAEA
jgi:ethanolamine-phosphate cytidylyltransferase